MTKNLTAHDLFWLARYAYNTLNPAVQELREVEPGTNLNIQLTFDDRGYAEPSHLYMAVHWEREGLALQEVCLTKREQIDRSAQTIRSITARLKEEVAA